MILSLLRKDWTFRLVPVFWLIAAFLGYMNAWSANRHFEEHGPHTIPASKTFLEWLLVNLTMATIYAFASARMFEISTPFQSTLPLRTRDLWLAKMIGVLSLVTGGSLVVCLIFWLAYEHPLHPLQIRLAFNTTALVTLLPFLYHSARLRIGTRGMPIGIYVPLIVGIAIAFSWIGMRTWIPGMLALLLTIVLGLRTYSKLPMTFELNIKHPGRARDIGEAIATGFAWLDQVPLIRRLLEWDRALRPGTWFTRKQLILVLSLSFALSLFALTRSLFTLALAYLVFQFAWFARTVNGEPRIAHLPLRRARIFYYATLPPLIVLAIAVGLLLSWVPAWSWSTLSTSSGAALGFVLYILCWYFLLYLLLAGRRVPAVTRSERWQRYLANPRYWLALAAVLLLATVGVGTEAGLPQPGLISSLAELLNVGTGLLWGAFFILAPAAFLGLRHEFLRTEIPVTPKEWSRALAL